jgi:dynamin 1-like protein
MLMHHIRDCLPELKNRISHMVSDVDTELDALGTHMNSSSRSDRGAALLNLLSKFATTFADVLEGRSGQDLNTKTNPTTPIHNSGFAGPSELTGGARISYIFTEIFASSLTSVGAFDDLSDEEIRITICNANGTRKALFVPEISFDILVRRQIARLEQPAIQCVDLVYEELQRIASQSEPSGLNRFPNLRDRVVEVVSFLLKRCVGPTQMMVSNLVKIELAYINTSHPDFIGGSQAVARLKDRIGKENKHQPASSYDQASGDTPLSSNSLNNYGYEDEADEKDFSTPHNNNEAAGGIMGLLFRGNAIAADKNKPTHRTPTGGKGPPKIVHLPQVPATMKQTDKPATEREQVEMEIIKSLMESYFAIVRKNIIDLVPKTIMYFLCNHVRDSLQNELVSELYREGELGNLMQEAEDIATRRQTCMEMKGLLSKAMEIVNEVREFNTYK